MKSILTASFPAILALCLAAPAAAQEPAQPAYDAIAGGGLDARLFGAYAGAESYSFGEARGELRITALHGGRWLRLEHQSAIQGERHYAALSMLRSYPDGEVAAWHFDDRGAISTWSGRADEQGLLLRNFDAKGNLLAVQLYRWNRAGFEFELHSRASADLTLERFLTASYAHAEAAAPFALGDPAAQRARELPYSFYVGSFSGPERGTFGPSAGTITTRPVLDGGWFLSEYASSAGGHVVYAGTGMTRCEPDGRTVLHWFDSRGDHQRLDGRMSEGAHRAVRRDAAANVLERHEDQLFEDRYRFRMFVPGETEGEWVTLLEAEYRRDAAAARPAR